MGSQAGKKEEKYVDIEDLLKESLADKSVTGDKEDMVLEYLCQTISKTDSYDVLKKKADQGDPYAYIQLASWHIAHAKNTKDYCLAYQYALKASRHGYIESYYILGQLYLYGAGCIKNVQKAIKYLSFFVHKVSSKDLLNDSVLVDAYLKLADAERSLGHYEKSYRYYQELKKIDSSYDAEAKEVLALLHDNQNEHASYLIYTIVALSASCIAAYFLLHYLSVQCMTYAGRYKIEQKVTIVEEEKAKPQSEPIVKPVEIQEPVSYTLVSQSDFESLGFQEVQISSVNATSEYISKKGNYYGADNLIDSDMETTWQEGEEDGGIGQSINFTFNEPAIISAMCIYNGKQTNNEAFYENNRIASFTIFEYSLSVQLPDSMEAQYIIFENPLLEDQVTLTLQSIFGGSKWNDTCITEIIFYE